MTAKKPTSAKKPTPAASRAKARRLGFEHRSEPLLSTGAFLTRLARSVLTGVVLMLISLGGGMVGYHGFEGQSWVDAFLEAAMLMGGMGPITPPDSTGGKLFAGFYALYCGLVLILVAGILLAPVAHRILHKFHADAPAD